MSYSEARFPLRVYMTQLWQEFAEQCRRILCLPANIQLQRKSISAGQFVFQLQFPNQRKLHFVLIGWSTESLSTAPHRFGFSFGPRLWLGLQESHHEDHFALESLIAWKKLIRRSGTADWSVLQRLLRTHAEYDTLQDEYFRRIFVGVTGKTANLRLGFRCNQDCHFCWQNRKWPNPPTEYYYHWLDEFAAYGVKQVVFTGGEPTFHKEFVPLVHAAKQRHGMKTMVQTNATMLSNPKYTQRLSAANVDRLFVSFHSANAEISDQMTRAPNTWRRTVQGIEEALRQGYRVGLNCIVEKDNYLHLEEQAQFIVEHFVLPFSDNPIESMTYSRPQRYFDTAKWDEQIIPIDLFSDRLQRAIQVLQSHDVLIDVTAGSCGLPACLLHFDTTLITLPKAGDVGMTDPNYSKEERRETLCGQCTLLDRCQGPGKRYTELFRDRGLRPFTTVLDVPDVFPLQL